MSVIMRQASRNSFGSAIPVLMPLYSYDCDSWHFASEGELLCGTGPECQFVLPVTGIEQRHCTLTFRSGMLRVRRLDGRVWVNDLPVNRESALAPGDVLSVGPVSFRIETTGRPASDSESLRTPPETSRPAVHSAHTPAVQRPLPIHSPVSPVAGDLAPPFHISADKKSASAADRKSPTAPIPNTGAAVDERLALVAEKERTIADREQQIQALNSVALERDRTIAERIRALDERGTFLEQQKVAIDHQYGSIELLMKGLLKQQEEMDTRLQQLTQKETLFVRKMEETEAATAEIQSCRDDLSLRLDAISRREAQLENRDRELSQLAEEIEHSKARDAVEAGLSAEEIDAITAQQNKSQLELDTLHAQISQQQARIDVQSSLLSQKSQELAAREAELEVRTAELESVKLQAANGSRDTRSAGELSEIAAEREAAIRARQESLTGLEEIRAAKVAITAHQARLRVREAEVDGRNAELASRIISIKAIRTTTLAQAEEVKEEWQKLAVRQTQLIAAEKRVAELDRNATVALRNAESEREALQNSHKDLICEKNSLVQMSNDLQSRIAGLAEQERVIAQQTEDLRSRFLAFHSQEAAAEKYEAELNSRNAELHDRITQFKREAEEQRVRSISVQEAAAEKYEAELNSRHAELHDRIAQFKREAEAQRVRSISVLEAAKEEYEAELNSRHAELHDRITQFKLTMEAQRVRSISAQADAEAIAAARESEAAQLSQVFEALQTAEAECAAAISERDSLLTAVNELRQALLDAQSDVAEAKRVRADAASHEQTIEELRRAVEERGGELQSAQSELLQNRELTESLQQRISDLTSDLEAMSAERTAALTQKSGEDSDCPEADLLNEVNDLRNGLTQSADANFQIQLALTERDQEIAGLQELIRDLRAELAAVPSAETGNESAGQVRIDELLSRISHTEEVLRDRDDIIRELQTRLTETLQQRSSAPAESIDAAQLHHEARELDHRANLLDEREGEIRERLRQIANSEEEFEAQRRQLLDARQQLEMARAEIQLAMKQHTAMAAAHSSGESTSPVTGAVSAGELNSRSWPSAASSSGADAGAELIDDQDSTGPQVLREELANLFGMPEPRANSLTGDSSDIPEFLDLSEPTGESRSVALRFDGDASNMILKPAAAPVAEPACSPEEEENADDFVREYMEQLLARSRQAAGNSLPAELQPQNAKSQTLSEELPPQPANKKASDKNDGGGKSGTKVKSFIDQYMSGGFGDLMEDGYLGDAATAFQEEEPASTAATPEKTEPATPRAKVDLRKMRENMDSFRTVSAQSLENALVNHAIRKERHSINGRIMLTSVMVVMSLFLSIADYKGIIHHPALIWITLVSAIGAAAELVRKFTGVKNRCKVAIMPDGSEMTKKKTLQNEKEIPVPPQEEHVAEPSSAKAEALIEARSISAAELDDIPDASEVIELPESLPFDDSARSDQYFEM